MAKLNFTIDATVAEFNEFADRLGYMTMVLPEGGEEAVANPETRQVFLQRVLKEKVSEVFYTPFVRDIETQVRTERDSEKETMRNTVRNKVAVNFSA